MRRLITRADADHADDPPGPLPAGRTAADIVAGYAAAGGPGEHASHHRVVRDLSAVLIRCGVLGRRWLADTVVEIAERTPVRDVATLQRHFDERTGDDLADALVAAAARTTAKIGAAGGALAAAEFIAPPTLLGAPVQIIAETLITVAVELKLVAELHAVYGVSVTGSSPQRAASYVGAWSRRSAIDRFGPIAMTGAARRQLQARLVRRLGRTSVTMAPWLAGAVAGALLSRRETLRVGYKVTADLRRAARRA